MTKEMVWILSRVQLPAYDVRVLACVGNKKSAYKYVDICTRDSTSKHGEHWSSNNGKIDVDTYEVYAWMPLPEALNER